MNAANSDKKAFHPGRLVKILALLSVIFVITLATAPLRPFFAEWRSVQKRYNSLAAKQGVATIPIGVKQIWKPELEVTDRCVTCHLGMGAAPALDGDPLFKAHPPIPHDPKEMGCTVCHSGQGRATTKESAHGHVSFWDEQMLTGKHLSAGCGTCHNTVPFMARKDLDRGKFLLGSLDCIGCHQIDNQGRGTAPNLSYTGLKEYQADWYAAHLAKTQSDTTGVWKNSFSEVSAEDLASIEAYLKSRVGAPRIVEAQALAMERGCLGCHKVHGRGGDEGVVLDAVGRKPVGDLNFNNISGERTFINYMRRHLMDPAGVVPGSLMPGQIENPEEADLLTSWILFLRGRELPVKMVPKDRLRREVLGEKPVALTGSQLFGAFCSACHAPDGKGRNYGSMDIRFPAIGSPDFLDLASDTFIEETLKGGRPGRRMPAFSANLTPEEIKSLVVHLRSLSPAPPTAAEVAGAVFDRTLGESAYRADCATCHGAAGQGSPLGSPLATSDGRRNREASYLAIVNGVPATAMPGYSRYDAKTLRSLLDYVAGMPQVDGSRSAWRIGTGDSDAGKALYNRNCAGCHGETGTGKLGPALANPGFKKTATDTYIAATIVRGRAGTPMPAFGRDDVRYAKLTPAEILNITAYIRKGLK